MTHIVRGEGESCYLRHYDALCKLIKCGSPLISQHLCNYSFVPNCMAGGWNKMHQGENYQDFLKWVREGVFKSFCYNN